MPSKCPVLTPQQIIKVLSKFGFDKVSQRKVSNGVNKAVVPNHYEVAKWTLKSVLEQAGVELEEFLSVLDK